MEEALDAMAAASAEPPNPAKPKKAKAKKPAKKAAPKKKTAKPKTKKKPANKAPKAPARVVERPERVDMRLTKQEKAKLIAKAKRLKRTVTSILMEAVAKVAK